AEMLESSRRARRCAEAQGRAADLPAAERDADRQSDVARGERIRARPGARHHGHERAAPVPALRLSARWQISGMEAARSELLALRLLGRVNRHGIGPFSSPC